MSIADELARLEALRDKGSLTNEEFNQAKSKILGEANAAGASASSSSTPQVVTALNGLHRSADDRWLGGVCGGLAVATGMASWIWRLLFVLLSFLGGCGFLLYIVLWIFIPAEPKKISFDSSN